MQNASFSFIPGHKCYQNTTSRLSEKKEKDQYQTDQSLVFCAYHYFILTSLTICPLLPSICRALSKIEATQAQHNASDGRSHARHANERRKSRSLAAHGMAVAAVGRSPISSFWRNRDAAVILIAGLMALQMQQSAASDACRALSFFLRKQQSAFGNAKTASK